MSRAAVDHPTLIRLSKAAQALAFAKDLSDFKKIINVAEAARVYIKAARLGEGAARHAEEIKLKAQRKAGEFLTKLHKARGGDRKSNRQSVGLVSDYRAAIDDAGIEERSAQRWQQVATIPENDFDRYLKAGEEEAKELTTAGLLLEFKRGARDQQRERTREQNAALVAGVKSPLDLGQRYQTIVIDPPWDLESDGGDEAFGRGGPTYATMPLEEIAVLPLGDLAQDNAHLYLWITNRSLPKGFALFDAWGFRYVTALAWVKPSFGMGTYFRGAHEHILFGVRGSLPLLRNNCPTWFAADRPGRHSQKPPEFYALVETCSPGPWLEMFARAERPGWVSWGAEIAA